MIRKPPLASLSAALRKLERQLAALRFHEAAHLVGVARIAFLEGRCAERSRVSFKAR